VEKSRECLKDAARDIEVEAYKAAANRSYYCIFHAMRAVLALDEFDSKKHSEIISAFRQRYIKTSIFPKEFSDIIGNAFDIRNDSDYEDFYVVSKDDVIAQVENARIFLASVENYINTLLPDEHEVAETTK